MDLLPDLGTDQQDEVQVLPQALGSLEYLQSIYRDPGLPTSTRLRAAIAALPFERPKLAVIANVGESFANRMEAELKRRIAYAESKLIEAQRRMRDSE